MYALAVLCVCIGINLAGGQELIEITYTAKNELTDDGRNFRADIILETERKVFIEMMRDAARVDSRFEFVTEEHSEHGHYVIAINGVYESVEDQQYWAFMKIENGERCFMPVGISSYIPVDGEHMLFEFVTWDFTAPSC